MRAVLQRSLGATLTVVDECCAGSCSGAVDSAASGTGGAESSRVVYSHFEGEGLVALVGVHREDGETDARKMARKIGDLRILTGESSVLDAGAPVLLVSQFTLYGRTRKGRRPSWVDAAAGPYAEPLIELVVSELRAMGVSVQTGVFGADMQVSLTNMGPFTVIVDTRSAD